LSRDIIAITGGAGFIGSALVWGLNRRKFDNILVIDSLGTSDNWKNLVNLKFSDYLDKEEFITKLEQGRFDDVVTAIIHMGACTDTTCKDAKFLLQNNYEYTKRLAEWCIKNNKRFLYASSAATYGDGKNGFSDDHAILAKLRPLNIYGYSKHLFDLWAFNNRYLEKIAGLKYFNVFGPNEYHKGEMKSVVCKAFEQIKETGKVKLFKSYLNDYKNGWQMRDFVYIKDVVEMTLFVFNNPTANGIFNIGTGQKRSFYDLVLAVFNSIGLKANIEYIEMPESIQKQYQYFSKADITKLCKLGYTKNIYSLEEAVDEYVKNYLLNEDPHLGNRPEQF
jgi:ADP-L-glycero-D-manno-heptose 6-epimerase